MLAPETLDTIVEFLSGDFCASTGEDRCPEFVDVIIRQGLPMIYAASNDEAVTEVFCYGNLTWSEFLNPLPQEENCEVCRISEIFFCRLATLLLRGLAQPS